MGAYNRLHEDTCARYVDGQKRCIYCNGYCVKNGSSSNKKQRFLCRTCKRSTYTLSKLAVSNAGLAIPQGVSSQKFSKVSQMLKDAEGEMSDDIVVQGSRANGTAGVTSDIDFAIRVGAKQFEAVVGKAFGNVNKGSAKERTMLHALKTGKLQAGEAKLSGLRKSLESELGMDVDVSVIKKGGDFDNGYQIQIK